MANETTEKKSSNSKTIIILLIIIILLLIGGGVTAFVLLSGDRPDDQQVTPSGGKVIPLEVTAGVLSPDKLKEWNEKALQEAKDTQIPVSFAADATSSDGVNFDCEIGNPPGAKHYMYLDIYSDTTLEEEVYLSGLLKPGTGITSFTTSRAFPKGDTEAVLVFTTVQDDMQTLIAQTMVVLTLKVS